MPSPDLVIEIVFWILVWGVIGFGFALAFGYVVKLFRNGDRDDRP